MSEPASAWAWFQVNPHFTASIVASSSQDEPRTGQPASGYR